MIDETLLFYFRAVVLALLDVMSFSLVACVLFLIHLSGAILIYSSLFLYEDEEKRFQNKIEEWWLRVVYTQATSQTRLKAFMQGVAGLTGKGFDVLFGKSFVSLRFIVISIYLSIASFFLFIVIFFPLAQHPGPATRHGAFFLMLLFLCLASVPAVLKDRWLLLLWWAVIPAAVTSVSGFLLFAYKRFGATSTLRGIGFFLLPFAVSFLCDLAFILLTRWILRRITAVERISQIALTIVAYVLILIILLLSPIFIGLRILGYAPRAGAYIMISFPLNSIDLLVAMAGLILALFLFLHRLLWPAIHRPLWAIYRFAPIRNKKLLFRLGVALIVLPRHVTLELLKAMLDKLS